MKKYLFILLLFPTFAFASVGHSSLYIRPNQETIEHVYWGFHIAHLKPDQVRNFGDFTDDFSSIQHEVKIEFSSGYNAGFLVGFQSGNWRFEGDLTWWESNHGKIKIDGVSTSDIAGRSGSGRGKTFAGTLMFNFYYDLLDQNHYPITPVVGAGFGLASINTIMARDIATTAANTKTVYNTMFGLALKASDDLTLQILFRQLVVKAAARALLNRKYQPHGLEYGFRYNF